MNSKDTTDLSMYVNKTATSILMVEDDSNKILGAIIDRDDNLSADKNFFYRNTRLIRDDILLMQSEIDTLNMKILKLANLFKATLKKDKFQRFADTIDTIPFEFFLTKKDAEKLLFELKE